MHMRASAIFSALPLRNYLKQTIHIFKTSTFEGHKIQLLSISKLFVYSCHSDIDSVLLKTTFSQISIPSQLLVKFSSDRRRRKNTFKAVENIGMASEKLYRNTLLGLNHIAWLSVAAQTKVFFSFFNFYYGTILTS